MTIQEQYQALYIDGSLFGLEAGAEKGSYFCTPMGMKVIGWEGVGGIHYGTIEGLGEMIYAVNPENFGDWLVFPIAQNFEDLLRLLLAAGSMAAIEQIQRWDKETFQRFLQENVETEETKDALEQIRRELNLTAMEDPFSYVKKLQENFEEGSIPYSDEYYDTLGLPRLDVTEAEEQGFDFAVVKAVVEG